MTGTETPVAAPPTTETFAGALSAFNQARDVFQRARDAVAEAEGKQAAAINALPAKDRANMAHVEAIADGLRLVELGDALANSVQKANAALGGLMRLPAATVLDLFEKLWAVSAVEWGGPDYWPQILADAGRLSVQFGEVWLEQWKQHGGSVTPDLNNPPDGVMIGHPEYAFSPDAVADNARDGAEASSERAWRSAFYDGQMRALSRFLDDMPGGLAAVKAIVLTDPARGLRQTVADAAEGR